MIDDPVKVVQLVSKLRGALPLAASATPSLAALMREQVPEAKIERHLSVMRVDYAGDDGGIICRFEVDEGTRTQTFWVSITHLAFNRRAPFAREIAAYQKHRTKRLKKLHIAELVEEALGA